jgi:hypothetical protein
MEIYNLNNGDNTVNIVPLWSDNTAIDLDAVTEFSVMAYRGSTLVKTWRLNSPSTGDGDVIRDTQYTCHIQLESSLLANYSSLTMVGETKVINAEFSDGFKNSKAVPFLVNINKCG